MSICRSAGAQRSARSSPSWSGVAPLSSIEPLLSPIRRRTSTSSCERVASGPSSASSRRLSSTGRAPVPASWIRVGATHSTLSWARFQWQASWSIVSPWRSATGLQRVQDQHRPVDQLAVALEAPDQVQREAVGRARCQAEPPRQTLVANAGKGPPDLLSLEAAAVGVVQEQQVEDVHPAALEAALGGHAHVVEVAVGRPEPGVGEARVAGSALALPVVEVVADRAHEGELVARQAGQGPADQRIGLAGAVHVRGHDRPDLPVGPQEGLEAGLVERLAEVHEPAAAPGPDGCMGWAVHGHANTNTSVSTAYTARSCTPSNQFDSPSMVTKFAIRTANNSAPSS